MTQTGEYIGPGRGKHYSGKDERWPWQRQTLGQVGENITLARTNDCVARANDGVARTNDRVARTNDCVARANDGVARTNDRVARGTSKSHKKEIMSLLSFHTYGPVRRAAD